MQGRHEQGSLLRAMVDLYAEAGYVAGNGERIETDNPIRNLFHGDRLSAGDELLIAEVREALTEIATGAAAAAAPVPPESMQAARIALGGMELVLSAEVSAGNADRLPTLLPAFAHLATLWFLGRTEALRMAELLEFRLDS